MTSSSVPVGSSGSYFAESSATRGCDRTRTRSDTVTAMEPGGRAAGARVGVGTTDAPGVTPGVAAGAEETAVGEAETGVVAGVGVVSAQPATRTATSRHATAVGRRWRRGWTADGVIVSPRSMRRRSAG